MLDMKWMLDRMNSGKRRTGNPSNANRQMTKTASNNETELEAREAALGSIGAPNTKVAKTRLAR
jgi:hypothetical protein